MAKHRNTVSLKEHLLALDAARDKLGDERDRRYQLMHDATQRQLHVLFERAATHVTFDEYRQAHRDVVSLSSENTKRIEELEGQRRGSASTWAWMIAAIGVISGAVIGIITLLVMHTGN